MNHKKTERLIEKVSLKINKLIYFGAIISFLFIYIYGTHLSLPFIIAEFLVFYNIFKLDYGLLIETFPVILIIVGQFIFLILGLKENSRIKLILFLSSPLLIIIGLLLFSMTQNEYHHRLPTIKTMIPFFIYSILFYVYSIKFCRINSMPL